MWTSRLISRTRIEMNSLKLSIFQFVLYVMRLLRNNFKKYWRMISSLKSFYISWVTRQEKSLSSKFNKKVFCGFWRYEFIYMTYHPLTVSTLVTPIKNRNVPTRLSNERDSYLRFMFFTNLQLRWFLLITYLITSYINCTP